MKKEHYDSLCLQIKGSLRIYDMVGKGGKLSMYYTPERNKPLLYHKKVVKMMDLINHNKTEEEIRKILFSHLGIYPTLNPVLIE